VELAAIWRISLGEASAIYHDRLQEWNDAHPEEPNSLPIAWADSTGSTVRFNLLRPVDVERALGLQLERVRTARWRTVPIVVHLPRWLVNAIARDHTTIPLAPANATVAARIERAMLDLFSEDEASR
jgi:hypothetical protein